jgi:hypothetical protein
MKSFVLTNYDLTALESLLELRMNSLFPSNWHTRLLQNRRNIREELFESWRIVLDVILHVCEDGDVLKTVLLHVIWKRVMVIPRCLARSWLVMVRSCTMFLLFSNISSFHSRTMDADGKQN